MIGLYWLSIRPCRDSRSKGLRDNSWTLAHFRRLALHCWGQMFFEALGCFLICRRCVVGIRECETNCHPVFRFDGLTGARTAGR